MRVSSVHIWLMAVLFSWCFVTNGFRLSAAEVSFSRDVMAVLSKSGCNMGTCHGNQNGKGGFKLSLRGENPAADFVTLTREQVGRRVNTVRADESLLLLKPTMSVPHEGGQRFDEGSPEYDLLRRWISDGMPMTRRDEPAVAELLVTPVERFVVEPVDSVQLQAVAKFTDGSTRDVIRLACFETSQPTVSISVNGLVRREQFGEVTVTVRYLDRQVATRLAFLPARPGFVSKSPTPANFIDQHIFAKLELLRINPSEICDDATFLRRANLDLLGIPPTSAESRQFGQDQRLDKRQRWIDELLTRPEFADFWTLKWADLLRVEEKTLDRKGVATFHAWIRNNVATNQPLNLFVHDLIAARGSTYEHPPANFYRAMRDPITRAETVAQVFLGTRLQCAKCHNHPFDRWTQTDYYGWANQFSQIKYEVLENNRRDKNDSHEFDGEQLVLVGEGKDVEHPGTGKPVKPRFLGIRNSELKTSSDRLLAVADWLTSRNNRRFAEAQVNRVWFHLLGRGIVDPIDDFRATNPPSNPALLAALTDDFVTHHFDVQHLIRTIMNSRTYQLSSTPDETNKDDESNFSHAIIRRLTAEQLADSFSRVLGATLDFNGYPAGTRAAQLAGVRAFRRRESTPSSGDQLLTMFGKPPRLQACECERADDPTLSQTFQIVSGPILNELLSRPENRLRDWLDFKGEPADLVDDIFWTILNRAPLPTELAAARSLLESSSHRRSNLEDLVWSLLSSPEFVLRH